jgi:hypothetical protein
MREVRSQAEGSLRELRILAEEYTCSPRTIFKLSFLETDKCNLSHENVLSKEFDFLLS